MDGECKAKVAFRELVKNVKATKQLYETFIQLV